MAVTDSRQNLCQAEYPSSGRANLGRSKARGKRKQPYKARNTVAELSIPVTEVEQEVGVMPEPLADASLKKQSAKGKASAKGRPAAKGKGAAKHKSSAKAKEAAATSGRDVDDGQSHSARQGTGITDITATEPDLSIPTKEVVEDADTSVVPTLAHVSIVSHLGEEPQWVSVNQETFAQIYGAGWEQEIPQTGPDQGTVPHYKVSAQMFKVYKSKRKQVNVIEDSQIDPALLRPLTPARRTEPDNRYPTPNSGMDTPDNTGTPPHNMRPTCESFTEMQPIIPRRQGNEQENRYPTPNSDIHTPDSSGTMSYKVRQTSVAAPEMQPAIPPSATAVCNQSTLPVPTAMEAGLTDYPSPSADVFAPSPKSVPGAATLADANGANSVLPTTGTVKRTKKVQQEQPAVVGVGSSRLRRFPKLTEKGAALKQSYRGRRK